MKKIILSLCAMLLILWGCGDTTQDVTAPGTTNPSGTVQGFVRDYQTNAPIENVTVTLYAAGSRTTKTDEVGYWYFNGVRGDEEGANLVYTLTAPDADEDNNADYLPMLGTTKLDESVGVSGGGQEGQTNSLATVFDWMVKTATVSGFVTDSGTGRGINEATVVILDFVAGAVWGPGLSNAAVDSQALTATTAARTGSETGDGYYSFTNVPALAIAAANFGAYATGYEYGAANIDASVLNLQFGSSAIVDFRLNPLDNNLGLVVASVTTATGTTTNMLILMDATGNAGTGPVPKVDMNGATQLVFNLIFDQAIDTNQFYGDTIQLQDVKGVVYPNLTPVWSTANYAVTLTGNIDIFDDTIANTYTLINSRIIYAAGGGIAAGHGQIGTPTNLARFIAYNSTFVATNPTPALFMEDTDTSLVGNVNVNLYSADSRVNPTNAQNYTGMWEENVLNPYVFTPQALANGVDIYWTDAAPIYDVSAISYYVRERDPASGEVLNNWAEATALGATFQSDDRFIARNLDVATQFAFTGGIAGQLRFGNVLDVAVVLDDTLGVENAIDTTKLLTLADVQAPEITGFFDFTAAAATFAPDYEDGMIIFSETMSPTGTTSVTTNNSALFSMTPAWVVDATDATTRLRLNAASTASATVSTAAAGDTIVAGTGVITFDTAGDADLFFVGQIVTVTYLNGDTETTNVLAIDTATPTITINMAGLVLTGNDFTQAAALSVSGTTLLRSGRAAAAFAGASTTDTDITFAGANNVAVDDTLILRKSTDVNADVSVTVVDYDSATGTATIASTDTTGYDRVIFPGDVLTVTGTDEAGNAMHANANEITPDAFGAWPVGAITAVTLVGIK